ncbi:MAG: hypothetical protein ED559_09645 [Phycisphaera sp.]|nr:MAG: hypothetical protein ED559_09645 [Phycisphaera sp.]
MAKIICNAVRVGVIGALGTGAAFLIAEAVSPGSARAIAHQAGTNISQVITNNVDDPVALREQLRSLEEQYPKKIATVRNDLTELQTQIAQFEHERAVAARVVKLADADLAELQHLLSQAEEAKGDSYRVVRVWHNNARLDMGEAYAKAEKIRRLRESYATRTSEIDRDLGFLQEQEQHLGDLLTTLETERADFQSQLWQLDQQIDAVSRNERLLDMLEKRQKTIDSISPFKADSLDHVTQRIAKIRAEQESRMESITTRRQVFSYEEAAKVQIDAENRDGGSLEIGSDSYEDFGPITHEIEIGLDDSPVRVPETN